MKQVIIVILFSFLWQSVGAQHSECGTVVTDENLEYMSKWSIQTTNMRLDASQPIIIIPVKFHSLQNTSGEGAMSTTTKDAYINRLNGYYSNANLRFEHVGAPNNIVNNEYYDWDGVSEGGFAVGNDVSGTINIYFFNSITGLCGYTRFPPSSDRIFVVTGCVSGGTLEHEVGHYFTLFHTHGKTNTGTTDELVDGSNCTSAGDNICDTSADPNLFGLVSASCAYTGSARDANGAVFMPDTGNIMSYTIGACRERLSTGQYSRARSGFENGRAYLNWTSDSFSANFVASSTEECKGGEIDFNGTSFGAVSFLWEFEGGNPRTSMIENPSVIYANGGFFDVSLTVMDNGGNEFVVSRRNYVKIIDPLDGALRGSVLNSFETGTLPEEFELSNSDFGFTFEIADSDADGSGSKCLFVNNYNYATENPGNIDLLESQIFSSLGVAKFVLSFDYAYTYIPSHFDQSNFIPERTDSILVRRPALCGFDEEVLWYAGGRSLGTVAALATEFIPSQETDWREKVFELPVGEDQEYTSFDIVSISYHGNNLYIDNLNIIVDYSVSTPTSFRVSKVVDGVVTLRWTDESVNESDFVIERSINDGAYDKLVTLDKNTIVYRDGDISSGNTYQYRLKATGVDANESAYTSEVEVVIAGVEEMFDRGYSIYPIPASMSFSISKIDEIDELELSSISLVDMAGRVVLKRAMPDGSEMAVDVSTLKTGFYVLLIESDIGLVSKKMVLK